MTGTGMMELLQNGLPYLVMGVFPAGCLTLFVGALQHIRVIRQRLANAQQCIAALETRLEKVENMRIPLVPVAVPAPKPQPSARQLTQVESGFMAEVERYRAANQHGTGMVV